MNATDDPGTPCDRTGRSRRKQRHAHGKHATQITGDIVSTFVALVREQKKADHAERAHKDIPHAGVIVSADGTLNSGFENNQRTQEKDEGERRPQNADGLSERQIRKDQRPFASRFLFHSVPPAI